jgi:WD40 repeat protein
MSVHVVVPASPYKGLSAFDDAELDALLFFGRERERAVIVANLLSSRLTVLYGETGVGKSSILRAGVARELRSVAPTALVLVHDAWADDPAAALADVHDVREAYVILDQFEEYFVYHDHASGRGTLLEALPELLLPQTGVNVLISLREDALGALDVFKPALPNVFANQLRLDRLDRDAARTAILGPVSRWNELAGEDVAVEPELVEAVLDEVATGRVDLGQSGVGAVHGGGRERRIEAPYLQLVMERIWAAERADASDTLRLATLRALGGAETIVRDHVENALDELDAPQKDAAARMFDHLVTPSGTKIAQRARDLAEYAAASDDALASMLSTLKRERILRTVDAGPSDGERYEIFHDVLAEPVLAWRARRQLERERDAAARRHRRLLVLAGSALAALAIVAGVAVYAWSQRSSAQAQARHALARELEARALSLLDVNSQRGLALALRGAQLEPGPRAEDVLRTALIHARLRGEVRPGAPVRRVGFDPTGRRLLVADTTGRVSLYDATGLRLGHELRQPGPVTAASFGRNGRLVAVAGGPSTTVWDARSGRRLLELRQGHAVANAVFDAAGTRLVTASGNTASIWRVADGRLLRTLRHPGPVSAASFSPDGRRVVTIAADRAGHVRARLFDSRSARLLHTFPERGLTAAVFSPDGRLLATTSRDGATRVHEVRGGHLLRILDDDGGPVLDAAFAPDGKLLATAVEDGAVRVWTIPAGERLFFFVGHTNPVVAVAWSPDGRTVADASLDRTSRLWAVGGVEAGKAYAILSGHRDSVTSVAFDPGGRTVVTGGEDGTVRVWDARAEQTLDLIGRETRPVASASFSPDGRLVVAAGGDGTARIRRAGGGLVATLVHRGPVTSAVFSRDGRIVLTAGADRTARLWTSNGRPLQVLRIAARVKRALLSPDGRFAVAVTGPAVQVWTVPDGRPAATLRTDGPAEDAAFSPDGTLVALASSHGTAVVRVGSWRLAATLRSAPVVRVSFSPSSRLVATAGPDGVVRIWSTRTGRIQHTLRGHTAALTDVEFSKDGRWLLTSSLDHDARMWEVRTGLLVHILRGHFGPVAAVAFSPDARWIATAGPISAGLWPASTGQLLFYLRGHTKLLTSVSFSPDGRRILSSSEDGTVRMYRCEVCVRLRELERLAEARLARAPS